MYFGFCIVIGFPLMWLLGDRLLQSASGAGWKWPVSWEGSGGHHERSPGTAQRQTQGKSLSPSQSHTHTRRDTVRGQIEWESMETRNNEIWDWLKKKVVLHIGHQGAQIEGTMCFQRLRGIVDWGWGGEEKRISLSGQVRERGEWDGYGIGVWTLGQGKDGKSHWDMRQKAKAQFSLALMPIFIPSLLACCMWTCNDISRRWDGGLGGTLSWAHKIRGRGGGGHKSATAPRYPTLPTLLAGSLTPALPSAPPLISEEICNQRSPHQHTSS